MTLGILPFAISLVHAPDVAKPRYINQRQVDHEEARHINMCTAVCIMCNSCSDVSLKL